MGKSNPTLNLPENPSLSFTLNSLCTGVDLTVDLRSRGGLHWVPEAPGIALPQDQKKSWLIPDLQGSALKRTLTHFERTLEILKSEVFPKYGLSAQVQSLDDCKVTFSTANTFPASSGIASSASSFAALTLAATQAFSNSPEKVQRLWREDLSFRRDLSSVSRRGSGSSCRSFEGPWVFWEQDQAYGISGVHYPKLSHFVILIESGKKAVSSSEAHSRVRTSPLWEKRVSRASQRATDLTVALKSADQALAARLSWEEAWEMHSLFHTCADPFSYWRGETLEALLWFSAQMKEFPTPIVTLDAGPNIHILVPKEIKEVWATVLKNRFQDYPILEDEGGEGPILL